MAKSSTGEKLVPVVMDTVYYVTEDDIKEMNDKAKKLAADPYRGQGVNFYRKVAEPPKERNAPKKDAITKQVEEQK